MTDRVLLAGLLALVASCGSELAETADGAGVVDGAGADAPGADGPGVAPISSCAIDVHQHVSGQAEVEGAVLDMIATMDSIGIRRALLMPPPQAAGAASYHEYTDYTDAAAAHAARVSTIGGGGTLDPRIHASAQSGVEPTLDELAAFEADAHAIADAGVAGFGEMTALHLSFQPWHAFIEMPPDHPMFLRLADVAAARGLPIDLHMELVDQTMATPADLPMPPKGNNPPTLQGNRDGFETLLAHNPDASIVWAHVGWDHIGDVSVTVLAALLAAYPNLYLEIHAVAEPAPAVAEGAPLDGDGNLRSEWRALIEAQPDRFLLGGDEFFTDGVAPRIGEGGTAATWRILQELPDDVARRIACENPARLYRL